MLAASAVTWFEIPSKDLARATRFYEDVLGIQLKPDAMGPKMKFSIFPADKGQPTGCVMQADGYRPSADSTTVYLNLRDDLSQPLGKVEKAGGKVLQGKTALPENMGFYAQFLDSEGNRVGFFSPR
jgi:predicted enzyme related to lactoylglutathione lyase